MNDPHFNLLRWTPAAASTALMILIAAISVRTVSGLKNATYWREHTFQVILNAQALEDKLLDSQSGVDNFTATGTPNLLIEYRNETNAEPKELTQLAVLTRDNSEQQRRLKNLSAAIKAVFDYDNRVIAVYGHNGPQAALQSDASAPETHILEPVIKDVEDIKNSEQILLKKRDITEQTDYHRAAHLLIAGSIIAAALLVFSNFFGSREMARRRRAETKQRELIEELQTSLAQVKTLSGLIPICGWCRNVRSDTGYWQSVEQYVRAHTAAKFSHGMCPACAEKWKLDMLQTSPAIPVSTSVEPSALKG